MALIRTNKLMKSQHYAVIYLYVTSGSRQSSSSFRYVLVGLGYMRILHSR